MLKFNNYPPKQAGDVEFTEYFTQNHRLFDPSSMGRLVAASLLENIHPEDRHNASEIMDSLVETSPGTEGLPGGIYGVKGRDGALEQFLSGVGHKLASTLVVTAKGLHNE